LTVNFDLIDSTKLFHFEASSASSLFSKATNAVVVKWNSENSCQGDDADGCGGKGGGGTAKNPFHSALNEIVNTLAQRDSSTGSMWYF